MESLLSKNAVRNDLRMKRQSLSQERRQQAAETLFSALVDVLSSYSFVLSFTAFQSEIETAFLNRYLAADGRLLLPKMENNSLAVYHVQDTLSQIRPNAFGLYEPIPALCQKIDKEQIDIVLVPGLGFDKQNHRIGYGKGYYDRFLPSLDNICTLGIGFKEQLVESLPIDKTDYPLSEILLF